MTKQIKDNMSKSAKNRPRASLETRKKISLISKARRWINDGVVNKFEKPEIVKHYLEVLNWKLGRIKK